MNQCTEPTLVPLADIRTDGGTQSRSMINDVVVGEYATAIAEGAWFPAVMLFYDGTAYWLADGFHRVAAHRRAGMAEVSSEIRKGTRRDAVLYSVGANQEHGLRRSNEDKRSAVMTLLSDDEWSNWSDREIARRCGVSHPTVSRLREEIVGVTGKISSEPRTYTTKHGNVARMNTRTAKVKRTRAPRVEAPEETQHDRDVRMLMGVWDAACESARVELSEIVAGRSATTRRPVLRQGKDAIRERVVDAITILSGLPPAHEVADYFAGTDAAIIISERIHPAATWIAEFSRLGEAAE